jgi:hypothetical protein
MISMGLVEQVLGILNLHHMIHIQYQSHYCNHGKTLDVVTHGNSMVIVG